VHRDRRRLNDLDLLQLHLAALFVLDERGRIARCRGERPPPPPRLHLARSRPGNLWRLRADLPRATLRRLATLASREAAGLGAPERLGELRRALEEHAPIEEQHCGPAFLLDASRAAHAPERGLVELGPDDASRLHPALGAPCAPPGLPSAACAPFVGLLQGGVVVSIAWTARGEASAAAEAGVETVAEARGRGLGTAAVAAWAERVVAAGGAPLYSTDAGNAAARRVAEKLGARLYGEDWSWR